VSSIPVIFSSKFRIAKIHGLPFQVIKSSHSWATPTYHCIRCVRNWVCWRDPYYLRPILRVHCKSFRQKLLHSHSVELIGLVILCVFFPFRLLSVLPGFVYKRPRLDLFFVVVVVIFLHFFIDSEQDTCKHIQLTNVPSLVIFCWVFLEKMMKILFPIEF
jgi:hypothetical protein